MEALSDNYIEILNELTDQIQNSDELASYLEEEEEEQYNALKDTFEPIIEEIYSLIALNDPLQLLGLEEQLLEPRFEGLFMPKILGYSVLRGEIQDDYKYVRPQKPLQRVLQAISSSSNFSYIKNRIGQGSQLAIALCTDIWITNLVQQFESKTVRQYMNAQKIQRYRDIVERKRLYHRYEKQFESEMYSTCQIPSTLNELRMESATILSFLKARYYQDLPTESFISKLIGVLGNKEYYGHQEHYKLLVFLASFFSVEGADMENLAKVLNENRKTIPDFDNQFMTFMLDLEDEGYHFSSDARARIIALLDFDHEDKLSRYFNIMNLVLDHGYDNPEVMEAIDTYYRSNRGLSIENKCLRVMLLMHLKNFYKNITTDEYPEFFEMSKIYAPYMSSFNNQKFNQNLKQVSLDYVKRLLKKFSDKRSREYQEIKRFVASIMGSLGLMTDKELVELFKTRRKKKVTA